MMRLCADEENRLTLYGKFLHIRARFLQIFARFVEINDVHPAAMSKQIGRHFGRPFIGRMSEVHACLEELLQ